jgi:hypothetical protein
MGLLTENCVWIRNKWLMLNRAMSDFSIIGFSQHTLTELNGELCKLNSSPINISLAPVRASLKILSCRSENVC